MTILNTNQDLQNPKSDQENIPPGFTPSNFSTLAFSTQGHPHALINSHVQPGESEVHSGHVFDEPSPPEPALYRAADFRPGYRRVYDDRYLRNEDIRG